MIKLLPNQINVMNSGSESYIYNKMSVIVERDAESITIDIQRKLGRYECSLYQQNDQ